MNRINEKIGSLSQPRRYEGSPNEEANFPAQLLTWVSYLSRNSPTCHGLDADFMVLHCFCRMLLGCVADGCVPLPDRSVSIPCTAERQILRFCCYRPNDKAVGYSYQGWFMPSRLATLEYLTTTKIGEKG